MAGDAPEYLAWVHQQPCVCCGRDGPSEAHHHTHRRGMGQRASDEHAMPLCSRCHWDFHNGTGKTSGMNQRQRSALQDGWVAVTRAGWDQLHDPAVF